MHINGAWVGWGAGIPPDPPDNDLRVRDIKRFLLRKFQWVRDWNPPLNDTTLYDDTLVAIVTEMQKRYGLPQTGIMNAATQVKCGFWKPPPVTPKTVATIITVNGTGVPDPFGPGFAGDVGRELGKTGKWYWQPIGYPAAVFPMEDSEIAGVAEVLIQIDRHPGPIALAGYSQGADVVCKVWRDHLLTGSHTQRRKDVIGIVNFGDPHRCPGIANGNKYAGQPLPKKVDGYTTGGIAGPDCLTPEQTPDFLLSFANDGDLYAAAPVGDTPWDKETPVGHNETLIYDAIMKFDGHDFVAFALTLVQILTMPFRQAMGLVQAIWNGLTFAFQGNRAPHWTYDPGPAIRYLTERTPVG